VFRPLVRAAASDWRVATPLKWYGELFAPDYAFATGGGRFSTVVDFMDMSLDAAIVSDGEDKFDLAEDGEAPLGDPTPHGPATDGP
jgi:hypothetical protein